MLLSLLETRTSEIVKINSKLETKQNYLLKKKKNKGFYYTVSKLLFLSHYKNTAQPVRMTTCEGQLNRSLKSFLHLFDFKNYDSLYQETIALLEIPFFW